MIRTGIFGGSFNPIHTGHISLAGRLLAEASLDEIWFIVSPLNPFKTDAVDLLDDEKRLELTRSALADEPRLIASDYEFHLAKPSYMWNTLNHFSHDYPERKPILIIGADNWKAFDRWSHAEHILQNYELVVYPREGYPIPADSLPTNVRLVNTKLYPLSSTKIRQMVKKGEDITGLVPEKIKKSVIEYYG